MATSTDSTKAKTYSLTAQCAEVERELMMRRKVYPNFVKSAKLTQDEADYHLACMESVLQTLRWLLKREDQIKQQFK